MRRSVHIHLHGMTADADPDGKWVTINGAHVFIGKGGKIEKGPKALVGKTKGQAWGGEELSLKAAQQRFPRQSAALAKMEEEDGKVIGTEHVKHIGGKYYVKPFSGGKLARDPAGPKESDKQFRSQEQRREEMGVRQGQSSSREERRAEIASGARTVTIPPNEKRASLGRRKDLVEPVRKLHEREAVLKRELDMDLKTASSEGEKIKLRKKYDADLEELQRTYLDD